MGFFDWIKCTTLGHDFGAWSEPSKSDCSCKRSCQRPSCIGIEKTVIHAWSDWKLKHGVCKEERDCTRCCKATEERPVSHKWAEWKLDDVVCKGIRVCTHCLTAEERVVPHRWSDWILNEAGCEERRACEHCRDTENRPAHKWTVWKLMDDRCEETRSCVRCTKPPEKRSVPHQWTGWRLESGVCEEKRICNHCQDTEERSVPHQWGVWQRESPVSDTLVRFCRWCAEGREIKEPYVILRVPKTDLANSIVASNQMDLFAPRLRASNASLRTVANFVMTYDYRQHGGGVEDGFRPQQADDRFSYLTWEWDEHKDAYRILLWDGNEWQ